MRSLLIESAPGHHALSQHPLAKWGKKLLARKGNQWYFGDEVRTSARIGTANWCIQWSNVSPAANVADITKTAELLHGQETQVHADAGYTGVEKREEIIALNRTIDWQIARKRGQLKSWGKAWRRNCSVMVEQAKASVRAFVEHPFHILKNSVSAPKGALPGLAKNGHQLHTLFGLANVIIGARQATG